MITKVYGTSDDLVEFEGGIRGEIGCGCTDERKQGLFVSFSDGTAVDVKYGKGPLAVWAITVLRKGDLFDRIEICDDADADIYSDQLFFKDGLKWAVWSEEYQKVE